MKSILFIVALMLIITNVAMGAVTINHPDPLEVIHGQPAVNIKLTQATAGAATVAFPTIANIKFDPATVTFTADGGNGQAKDVAITATADLAGVIIASSWSFTVTGDAAADNAATSFAITIVASNTLGDILVTFVSGGTGDVKAIQLTYGQAPVKIKFTMIKENKGYVGITFPSIPNINFSPPNSVVFFQNSGDNVQETVTISLTANVDGTHPASTWSFGKEGNGAPDYKLPHSFDITKIAIPVIPITFVNGGAPVNSLDLVYEQPPIKIRFTLAKATAGIIAMPTNLYDVKFDPLSITFTADGGDNQVKDVAVSYSANGQHNAPSTQNRWGFSTSGVIAYRFPINMVRAPEPKTPTVQILPEKQDSIDPNSGVMTLVPNFFVVLCAVIIFFAM